jgi:hypothetical protein
MTMEDISGSVGPEWTELNGTNNCDRELAVRVCFEAPDGSPVSCGLAPVSPGQTHWFATSDPTTGYWMAAIPWASNECYFAPEP